MLRTYNINAEIDELISELSKSANLNKSELIRDLVKKEALPMLASRSQAVALEKADTIIEKFFDNVANTPDNDWLTLRQQAGDLLLKRACILHPADTPEQAMAKVADAPDPAFKSLYALQCMKSQDAFAAYKQMLRSGGQ